MATESDHERADELRELGEAARRRRDLPTAQKCYEEASSLLRNSADTMRFAHTVRHLGDVYVDLQNWTGAEKCYLEALDIYRSQPAVRVLDFANAIRSYAVLKDKTGRPDESRSLWTEAGRLYQDQTIEPGIEECNRHIAQPVESSH